MDINAVIFGSSGMVGKGVLLECIDDERVKSVLLINRTSAGVEHSKVKEILHNDFTDYSSFEEDLKGYNACYYCLGISAIGLSESKYKEITYNFTLSAAKTLLKHNPDMTFCYVSGAGTDSTEEGSSMWARVKGKTENDLLALGFKDAYMFRPGYIQPMKGIKSKTGWYNALYVVFKPLFPFMKLVFGGSVTTSVNIGKAMIYCSLHENQVKVVGSKNINKFAEQLS